MNNKIIIYTDGASRGNPGPAAIGMWIETLDKKYGETIGVTTNNDAEYQALIVALKKTKSLLGKKRAKGAHVECRMDSELIVKQLTHQYKISHVTTQKHFITAWNLMLDFTAVSFVHIPRAQNTVADGLCNDALDAASRQRALV